jgi:hypothetical protein
LTELDASGRRAQARWATVGLPLGALLAASLVAFGLRRIPTTLTAAPPAGALGLLGILIMLALYAAAGRFAPPWLARRRDPARCAAILNTARLGGIAAGLVFAAEILLEYSLLPADNSGFGAIEFGLVFVVLFVTAVYAAWRTGSLWDGVIAALGASLLASLIWYIAVLTTFYAFNGTPQQAQVLRAEGDVADFSQSGMNDFAAWMMQDFLGAGFFHLLLAPLLALILGLIGGALGRALAHFRPAQAS